MTRCPGCNSANVYARSSKVKFVPSSEDGKVKEVMNYLCRKCGKTFFEDELVEKGNGNNPLSGLNEEQRKAALEALFNKKP